MTRRDARQFSNGILVGITGGRDILVPLGIGEAAETKEPPGPEAQEVLASTGQVLA
jgi:hypothetical protein